MRLAETSDLWWKTAVFYCLDVQTFQDWDGDGCGDLVGLVERLDHLVELGVTCLWLMPFHPSSDRDDGYDVVDHYAVDHRFGTHGDFVELVRTARERGLRVVIDLVVNHTSADHRWFVDARSSKDSAHRDFYVWRSDPPPDTSDQVVFPDAEDGIWTLEETTGEWYLHHFYSHQPDLNIDNPRVRDAIAKLVGFWLELGVSGFRVDAVPYAFGDPSDPPDGDPAPDPHDYLRALRQYAARRRGDSVLLGEVNLPYERLPDYFGGPEGDELTMMFDFVGMQRLHLALAREDATPLVEALRSRPELPLHCQLANFVRNHDELTLDKLTEEERQEVFDAFGPEESMQLFGRGLRRRLPPMLDGDPDRIRLAYSLMFTLPGTPVLFYGEEIGMGENLDIPGRLAVRTPMQWTAGRNGGFSSAEPDRLQRQPPRGRFGPEQVNVAAQRHDPDSLFGFMKRLIAVYRQSPELGWAQPHILDQPFPQVLAHECRWDDRRFLAVHNFSATPREVPLAPEELDGGRVSCLASGEELAVGDGGLVVEVGRYGHRWLRLLPEDGLRS